MTSNKFRAARGIALLAAVLLPVAAHAHKAWMLPSQTVLSQKGFITVDAAVSNDLFYFNHNPLRLDDLVVTAPDGSKVEALNKGSGKFRSTFDLDLQQEGTYRIVSGGDSVNASWDENGTSKRWRGPYAQMATNVPKDAKKLEVRHNQRRIETFVTVGKPSNNLKPSGAGLELVPVTHPNDLYVGDKASFQFLLDGKPVAGVEMEVVPGGSRYRDAQNEIKVKTDAQGKFDITWPVAGMYWLEASAPEGKSSLPGITQRSASYIGVFEVLPQ
jgi:uncharacterized GH25 family protein